MNLVVDIGNTRTKAALFNESELAEDFIYTGSLKSCVDEIFSKYHQIHNTIISTVKKTDDELLDIIKNKTTGKLIELNASTPVPIKNLYLSPESLGKDRLAAVVGAYTIYKDSNVLIIDAGTAITYDFLNSKGEYSGGNISAGMEMRFKALNQYTAKLPKYSSTTGFPDMGYNTETAIISGVLKGIIFEIEGYISLFSGKYKELKIIITGGDADFFVKNLKKPIFVIPNLILTGLNHILKYNEKFN